ncbi:hypothetical protein pEaSNUABM37_00175 [Erwinia phage pEa_SNUABM_37]|nr:hypothetical protein pEaSNUABM37_00175 [Erwinia phage pEa_SNUABM_37]QXO10645.1 hypothetical protein pEaSNUABM48_00175 [Erwinia phage pEa_SNUABM_48]
MESTDMQDMLKFLEFWPSTIGSNVEILTPANSSGVTFHISTNNALKSFEPRVSRRTMNKEDRSVPRVSTAATLNGCLSGYSAALYDWEGMDAEKWQGGWKIYAIPYEVALKPNKKILGDADQTEEIWLVPYNKAHVRYPATPIGEIFFTKVGREATNNTKMPRKVVVRAYVRIAEGNMLPLNKSTVLRAGYYQLTYNNWFEAMDLRNPQDIMVMPITSGDYNSYKKLGAGNLGLST